MVVTQEEDQPRNEKQSSLKHLFSHMFIAQTYNAIHIIVCLC